MDFTLGKHCCAASYLYAAVISDTGSYLGGSVHCLALNEAQVCVFCDKVV